MTDIEKLESLLTEFGVGYTRKQEEVYGKGSGDVINCSQGDEKVEGYCCFFTEFIFNLDGEFEMMGAWE